MDIYNYMLSRRVGIGDIADALEISFTDALDLINDEDNEELVMWLSDTLEPDIPFWRLVF